VREHNFLLDLRTPARGAANPREALNPREAPTGTPNRKGKEK
jgi:hypothetical protein